MKGKSDTAKEPWKNSKYSSLSCQWIVLKIVLLPLGRTPHNDAVIKERHLKMLTTELRPQGICDLAEQVVLFFSAALRNVLTTALFQQQHFQSAAGLSSPAAKLWQRRSLSHQSFCNTCQRKKKTQTKEHLPIVNQHSINVVYNSRLPLTTPSLESRL